MQVNAKKNDMEAPRVISLFRYTRNKRTDANCLVLYNTITKEEHIWQLAEEYPADEFLYDEKLDETTVEKCGLQFLRWLAEEDNLKAADLIILPIVYGAIGLIVIKENNRTCKKLEGLYKKFRYVGKLNGTPYIIRKFNAL